MHMVVASSRHELAPACETVTVFVAVFDPLPLPTVRATANAPAVAKACVGLWAVELNPSPKSHDHEVGPPVDVSVNWTVWPGEGDGGLKEKLAAGPALTGFVTRHTPRPYVAAQRSFVTGWKARA
jgi:hypothetical protein